MARAGPGEAATVARTRQGRLPGAHVRGEGLQEAAGRAASPSASVQPLMQECRLPLELEGRWPNVLECRHPILLECRQPHGQGSRRSCGSAGC